MEQRGQLISAIFEYCEDGDISTYLDPVCDMAFSMIKDTLDRDAEKYENIRKRNIQNGKSGGRPKKQNSLEKEVKTQWVFWEPKKADNGNVNVNDNVNDNDNVIDNGSGNDNVNDNAIDNGSGNGNDNEASVASTTTHIEKEIKDFLESKGVPPEYIEYVEMRAAYYSGVCGKDVGSLVLEWWQSDRSNPKWGAAKSKAHTSASPPPNNDVEAWLEARLKKTFGDGEG